MKFCDECGEKLESGKKFCPKCGKNLNGEKVESKDDHKLKCPHCGSNNVQVQIVSQTKNAGCLTVFLYLFLALTIIGIPIMILILLLKGKKTVNNKYYVCQNCGKNFNLGLSSLINNRKNNTTAGIIAALVIIIGCVVVAVAIATQDTDYVEKDQYQELDVQVLHNDYVGNEISAKDKYTGNYYYFTGEIYNIEEFLNDKYLEIRYKSTSDKNRTIELDAYFNSEKDLDDVKKGDTVTVYCKFKQRGIEDYAGITTYSFHSCKFFNETSGEE